MASNVPDEAPHSDREEKNLARRLKNKRARRVSFADTEITSVHIFRRDEDYETPPESNPRSETADAESQPDNEVLGFFGNLTGDIDDDEGDEGSVDGRKLFLRSMGSPSPGSSSAGYATPNNEDNSFGPVSASFIRPGRLSDSAGSDEIHEETLDTTAFSMHYRSLARSDSGELKIPTAVRLVFEEKTTTKDPNPTDSGSLMALAEPKRVSSESLVALEKGRGGEDSDDSMSIVDEHPKTYDYGTLSPRLDALLEEGSKDLTKLGSEFPRSDQKGLMDHRSGRDLELVNLDTNENLVELASLSYSKLSEAKAGFCDRTGFDFLSKRNSDQISGASSHQIQSPKQLPSGSKRFVEDATNESTRIENSLVVGRHDTNHHSYKQHGSQLEGSPISLSARRQQSILNTPNSLRISGIVSPSCKLIDLQSNEHRKHNESILSIEQSISRSKIPDTSFSGSSINQGTDKLKQRLSKYSSISSPFGSVLDENSKELQSKYGSTPIARLAEQFFTADAKDEEDISLVGLKIDRVETPRNTSKLGQNKEATGLARDGQPLDSMSMGVLSKDGPNKIRLGFSPFGLASSVTKVMQQALISEGFSKKIFTSGTNLLFVNDEEVSFPHMNIDAESLRYFQLPADKGILNFQLESSENLQTTQNTLLSKSSVSGTRAEAPSFKSPSMKESCQTPIRKVPTQSPAQDTPSQKATWKELTHIPFTKSPFERILPRSPLRKELTPRSPINMQTQSSLVKEPTQIFLRKEPLQSLGMKELILDPSGYEATHGPSRIKPTESPSRLESSGATHVGNMQSFPGKDMTSTWSNSGGPGSDNLHQGHMSQSPFFTKDVEVSLERKKRSIGVVLEDGKHTYKTARIQKSSEVHESANSDSELMYSQSNKIFSETDKVEGGRTQKYWLDTWVAFSRNAEQLLSPSINKLNVKAIGMLEDTLIHSLKVKKYEMLAFEIKSQSVSDHFSVRHNKRVAETKSLLYKIACEKVKLQLMGAKKQKLLKRVQFLNFGIQECEMLKLNYIQQSKSGRRDTQLDDTHLQSCAVNGEHQDASDTLSTMKKDVKELDTKINRLSNIFHSYCNLKLGDPSCADTLSLVYDNLKRRKCFRLLHQELQLWNVHGFENQNGLFSLFLKYQDYFIQRFTLNIEPQSSILVANQLNDINIVKMFPNMDVHVAFAFVLNAEVTKPFVDSKCLAQETQVTQSLLRNLLDVIEEVQMAQIEIGNLIETNFHSPSGQQLNLQLCFVDFHTGIKVTLNLDVTCLNRGVYPLQILPYQVHSPPAVAQKRSLLGEIRSAAENLEVGYSRLLRLCRCISQVLLASRT